MKKRRRSGIAGADDRGAPVPAPVIDTCRRWQQLAGRSSHAPIGLLLAHSGTKLGQIRERRKGSGKVCVAEDPLLQPGVVADVMWQALAHNKATSLARPKP